VSGSAATVQSLAYGVDADGDITAISDAVTPGRSQGFQYDALRRLTQASGVYGTLAYSYDAVGNRLSLSGGNNNLAESYGYAGGSNQLLSVAYGGATRQMSYTAAGALASNDNGAGTVLSFAYNQQNRLAQVASNGIGLAQYQENFLGERVAKSTAAGVTQFHYDRAGRLIAESDNLGNVLREHLWLEDMAVGYVTGGALYFVHPDHLGTPQRITDGGQNVVWDAAFAPFGWAAQLTAGVTENLRFPGQYADAETGLSYSLFRDYDPGIGRYVESDPIGLWGGINTYFYVGGNPMMGVDLWGLYWQYSQSTGQLTYVDDQTGAHTPIGSGYAGNGPGLNNPNMQNVPDIGPLPQGTYTIGPQQNNGNNGRLRGSEALTGC
jgi:RHS repeat-associated protein